MQKFTCFSKYIASACALQVDFNMANDRHLTRLNEKAEDAGSILDNLHGELKDAMGSEYHSRQATTDYQNLKTNFDVFCEQYR